MKDHISRIQIFLEVARQQSFAAAARSFGMTGPALSKQVQALEDQLGARLLQRTTRQVSLTQEGEIYFERASRALDDLKEAESYLRDLKETPTGLLRINAPMSFGKQYLTKMIAEFARDYPKVTLDIHFDDKNIDMIEEGFDILVRIGALQDSSLIVKQLAPCPIIPCVSPLYVVQNGAPEHPDDLKRHRSVIYTRHGRQNIWRYRHSDGAQGSVALTPSLSANNAEMMLEACLSGIGVALLPIFTAYPYLETGALAQILPDYHTTPTRQITALFPEKKHIGAKTRLFLDRLQTHCRQLPWC